MALGILSRPRKTKDHRIDEDPRYLPIDSSTGVRARPAQEFPSNTPPETTLNPPRNDEALPSGRRIEASPNQPPFSSVDEMALGKVASRGRTATPREEYDQLSQQPSSKDKNGRVKSAILNALFQMSQQASRVASSGRPVDAYGLASVAGSGIGGAAAGAFEPSLDEQQKRRMRMADLEQQISSQLRIEQEQAQTAKLNAETEYTRDVRPEVEAAKARARDKPPKPFIIGGKRINYRRPEDWDGEPGQWEPYEETVKERAVDEGSKLIEDKSKVADEDGFLPSDKLRKQLSDDQIAGRRELANLNNKFKAGESQKDRDFKGKENEKDRQIRRAMLSEQIGARLERDKQAGKRLAISVANVKIEADKWGVNVNDYIDALSDNGVTVVQK